VDPAQEENEDMLNEWTPPAGFWEEANVGDAVRLQQPGWPPHDGFVEDKTANGDVVWVVSVGARRLFHKGDGYSLVVRQ
jgi:L-ascorbate metabolism protein UlaG (beta-lactamase superfamily)